MPSLSVKVSLRVSREERARGEESGSLAEKLWESSSAYCDCRK